MRINLALVFGGLLVSCPVLAQNYSVQPAPSYWNLPQQVPQQPQYQPPVQQEAQAPVKKNKHTRLLKREKSAEDPVFVGEIVDDAPNQNVKLAQNNGFAPDLQNAINCSASIQVVSLAAPKWGKSDGVVNSSNLWLAKVFELAEKNNVGGDKINQILKTEMEKQTNENLDNLDALTNRAFECASNPPR